MKPTFNPEMGYIDYVVPAVFVLILQQTLVMASGLMGGTQKHGSGHWSKLPPLQLLAVRTTILVAIYYVLAMFYFGASFSMHGVNQTASATQLLSFLLPFLLASTFIGIWLGQITPRRELVTLVVLISSMPLIFSAGFIWPTEMLPKAIIILSQLFPSTPAIEGFLKLNQMSASWQQVAQQYTLLWGQVLVWGAIALYSIRGKENNTRTE